MGEADDDDDDEEEEEEDVDDDEDDDEDVVDAFDVCCCICAGLGGGGGAAAITAVAFFVVVSKPIAFVEPIPLAGCELGDILNNAFVAISQGMVSSRTIDAAVSQPIVSFASFTI